MIIRTMLLTVYLSITITNADSQFVTIYIYTIIKFVRFATLYSYLVDNSRQLLKISKHSSADKQDVLL